MRTAFVALGLAILGCTAEGGADALPALVKVRYLAGKGEDFAVREAAGVQAVMAWLERAESGPMSEHERIGLCTRDAEMYFYGSPEDTIPSRTVFLYIGCGHVSGRVVKAEQFAELRKILAAAAKGAGLPSAGGKP